MVGASSWPGSTTTRRSATCAGWPGCERRSRRPPSGWPASTASGGCAGTGFFHGYDRDLSFAVREAGYRCVVVAAPFVHRGGGTRTGVAAPVKATEDLTQRRAARARFAHKWRHRLPCDVRGVRERVADWLVAPPRS